MNTPYNNKIVVAVVVGAAIVMSAAVLKSKRSSQGNLASQRSGTGADASAAGRGVARANEGNASGDRARVENVAMLKEASEPNTVPSEPAGQERPSKRAYSKFDFTNLQTSDYKLDGVIQTPEGITLPPSDKPDEPRIGSMESPSIVLKQPSNMVVPIWRSVDVPSGNLKIEVAVGTEDGQWSHWYPIDFNSDPIAPTYPDGSPNPNYGARPGTPVGFGLELYSNVKFRATLTATGQEAPVLQSLDIYHTDSTDGDGYAASGPPPIHQQIIDAAAAQ